MCDNLVERLQSGRTPLKDGKMMTWEAQCAEAAERIKELKAKLTKAIVFLSGLDRHGVYYTDELEDLLAELKGESDE
ncbi:hypothetical protein N9Z41_02645 [bacterium]|nr:hypothetical protein [bacterium]